MPVLRLLSRVGKGTQERAFLCHPGKYLPYCSDCQRLLARQMAGLAGYARVASANHPRGHAARNHRPGTNDCSFPNTHARMNKDVRGNPSLVANGDGADEEWKAWLRIVMGTRDQVCALRNHCPVPNRYSALTVKDSPTRHCALIGQHQVPGCPDFSPWVHVYPPPYLRAKTAQHKGAPRM